MEIFLTLVIKLIPLYLIIFIGFLAGKFLKTDKEEIAKLVIYCITPMVIFNKVINTEITISALSIPVLIFVLLSAGCIVAYKFSRFLWKDHTRNIFAFAAVSGNTGYFGLPVAIALFDEKVVGLYVFALLGGVVFENTVGFFITARGKHTVKESLLKVVKLPTLYAFFLGLLVNVLHLKLGTAYVDFSTTFQGGYTLLGMMLVGFGIAGLSKVEFDGKFIGATFVTKFLLWPAIFFAIIFLDKSFIHFYNDATYRILTLYAIVPMAANTVALASLHKIHPEKAALAVLLSTIFALVYVPFMISVFLR
ncbi:MAG: AEC family transporter [bacterium]